MASDENMTFHSSLQDEDFDDDIEDGLFDHHHQQPHPHNLSRLSVCTSSTLCGVDDEDDDVDNAITMYMSHLSIESFEGDGDADGEFSDGKEIPAGLYSDSESEFGSCYSLPATPSRRRNRVEQTPVAVKDYASDNEARKGKKTKNNDPWRKRRNRRIRRDHSRWVFNNWDNSQKSNSSEKKKKEDGDHVINQGFSGESDQSVGGGSTGTGVMVITRPKGGRRSLCMDLEEVKACRDLGFELEHEGMLEMMPSRLSLSNSTLDTASSGSNSPIANWRISSPGDDPRDVKARLKVWAQAVALASASKYGT